jgi:hypothetical protein
MKKLFDRLRHSLVIRVIPIYAIMALLLDQFIGVAISHSWLPETFARTSVILAVIYFFAVLWIASAVQMVEPQDRLVFFKQLIWVIGPGLLLLGPLLLDFGTDLLTYNSAAHETTSNWRDLLLIGLLIVAVTIWMLMSAPFARAWAMQRVQDTSTLAQAEEKLLGSIKQAEAHISPKIYYAFLASVAAIFFLVVEALVSEFFDETFGLPGYTGALVAALGIAAFIYPAHKRVSKFITLVNQFEDELNEEDAKFAAKEVAKSWIRYHKLDVPHGYKIVIAFIVIALVTAFVKLYPYF